ncbi:hypothetical protein TIFTF001_004181 [Ficus carica]|uniref:Uncharacterized protein n=1 Tax=Ficus carica TaxID=3494 RepID=A0AA87ZHS6_FICCA|nr:hypothetical protein TIFTF001_004181 [Ficus carica]
MGLEDREGKREKGEERERGWGVPVGGTPRGAAAGWGATGGWVAGVRIGLPASVAGGEKVADDGEDFGLEG